MKKRRRRINRRAMADYRKRPIPKIDALIKIIVGWRGSDYVTITYYSEWRSGCRL